MSVKLKKYQQATAANQLSHKLEHKYFRPFTILDKIGEVAYKLQLYAQSKIHNVFHYPLLKLYFKGETNMGTKVLVDLMRHEDELFSKEEGIDVEIHFKKRPRKTPTRYKLQHL